MSRQLTSGVLRRKKGIVYDEIIFGYLYNYFAITDLRGFSNGLFSVPTDAEITELRSYIFNNITSENGRAIKSERTQIGDPLVGVPTNDNPFWLYDADRFGLDLLNLKAEAGGYRIGTNGSFTNINARFYLWSSTESSSTNAWFVNANFNAVGIGRSNVAKQFGFSACLVRDASVNELSKTDGDFCDPYTGNDGKIYRTVKIGNQVWTRQLAETKYNNGDSIPVITVNTSWRDATEGAMCAYNNNENLAILI